MTIHEYRRVFRERWLSIVLVVLISALAGAGVHFLRPPKYTASLQMYISTRAVDRNEGVFSGEGVADRRVKSYVKLATSERVTSTVVRQLGLPTSAGELGSRITAASSTDSVVIDLFAVDTSPEEAAAIANAVAQALAGLVDELEAPTTPDNVSPVVLKIVQPASVPTAPTGRGLSQWVLLGLLVGVAGGVVLALVRNSMDNTIKSLTQLRVVSGVPNLGVISFDSQVRRRPLIVHDEPQSAHAEAFRQLRTNVQFVDLENQHKILTVASPMAGEGKTTMLVNLAIALGAAGGSVLIVEADLRRPKAADMLGMDRSVGLTSVIAGRVPVHQAIRSWSSGPIDLLASGALPPNPSELLANPRMRRLLNDLRNRYDVILVDTPPLIPVTDAAAIATATDGVILLCQFHQTTRQQVDAAVEALHAVGAPILGSVFTKVPGLASHDAFSPVTDRSGTARPDIPAPVRAAPAARTQPPRPARAAMAAARRRSGAGLDLLDAPTQKNLSPVNTSPRPNGVGGERGGGGFPGYAVPPGGIARPAVGPGNGNNGVGAAGSVAPVTGTAAGKHDDPGSGGTQNGSSRSGEAVSASGAPAGDSASESRGATGPSVGDHTPEVVAEEAAATADTASTDVATVADPAAGRGAARPFEHTVSHESDAETGTDRTAGSERDGQDEDD